MGIQNQHKATRKKKAVGILATASIVFAKTDFHAVSIDEIAKQAGVARGTVYNHFGSKDQLYREVLSEQLSALMNRLRDTVAQDNCPLRNMRRCVVQPFLFFTKYPNLLLLWQRENLRRLSSSSNEGSVEMVAHYREDLLSLMQEVLTCGMEQKIFANLNLESTSRGILGAIEGVASAHFSSLSLRRNMSRNMDRIKEELCTLVQNGIAAKTDGRLP